MATQTERESDSTEDVIETDIERFNQSYGFVLVLITASFILDPVTDAVHWTDSFPVIVQSAAALLALYISGVPRRLVEIAIPVAVAASTIGVIFTATNAGDLFLILHRVLGMVLLGATLPAIGRKIMSHPSVNQETILGAVCIYVIFGMFYTMLYATIGALSPYPFFSGKPHASMAQYQFFSFTTLTTVGYGNLTPREPIGQSLAILEALTGSIYLVTMVARLVGLFGTGLPPNTRRQRADHRSASEHPGADRGEP